MHAVTENIKKGLVVVRDEYELIASIEESGDEMIMLAEKLNVPILVSENKTEAALTAQMKFDMDCIIIDDGFQHRRLHRDLDIVLINDETLLNPVLLPEGWLREPLSSLKRADIICYMGNQNMINENYKIILSKLNLKEDVLVCKACVSLDIPYILSDGKLTNKNTEKYNIKYAAVAGIANPKRFQKSLLDSGYNVEHTFWYKDHHDYTRKDILELIKKLKILKIENIITTEKDYVKIRSWQELLLEKNILCWVIPLKVEIFEGKELFEEKVLNLFINQYKN